MPSSWWAPDNSVPATPRSGSADRSRLRCLTLCCLAIFLAACTRIPEGIEPVSGFELERYLGTWYEIARLDHGFERGLEQVTATYTLNQDGTVTVDNRGYSPDASSWKEATGRARFAGSSDIGHLEVSFFGPFYGPYVIFELDQQGYQYAYVTSSGNALWLLARTPEVEPQRIEHFIERARRAGYATEELIFVRHE